MKTRKTHLMLHLNNMCSKKVSNKTREVVNSTVASGAADDRLGFIIRGTIPIRIRPTHKALCYFFSFAFSLSCIFSFLL